MKDKFSSYQSAIVKYCENLGRKTPAFIKSALQDLRVAISQEPEKSQGSYIRVIDQQIARANCN